MLRWQTALVGFYQFHRLHGWGSEQVFSKCLRVSIVLSPLPPESNIRYLKTSANLVIFIHGKKQQIYAFLRCVELPAECLLCQIINPTQSSNHARIAISVKMQIRGCLTVYCSDVAWFKFWPGRANEIPKRSRQLSTSAWIFLLIIFSTAKLFFISNIIGTVWGRGGGGGW